LITFLGRDQEHCEHKEEKAKACRQLNTVNVQFELQPKKNWKKNTKKACKGAETEKGVIALRQKKKKKGGGCKNAHWNQGTSLEPMGGGGSRHTARGLKGRREAFTWDMWTKKGRNHDGHHLDVGKKRKNGGEQSHRCPVPQQESICSKSGREENKSVAKNPIKRQGGALGGGLRPTLTPIAEGDVCARFQRGGGGGYCAVSEMRTRFRVCGFRKKEKGTGENQGCDLHGQKHGGKQCIKKIKTW